MRSVSKINVANDGISKPCEDTKDRSGVSMHWANLPEAGTAKSIQVFYFLYKALGDRICRVLAYPVTFYFFFRLGTARRASLDYLQRIHQLNPASTSREPGLIHGMKHFLHFANALIDKAVAWSRNLSEDEIEMVDQVAFDEIVHAPGGKLIIGSHFGNLEYCRGFSHQHQHVVINVLIHDQHAVNFAEFMNRVNPASRVNLFQVTEIDIPMVLKLKSLIDKGEWVVIAGDRVPVANGVRTTEVNFLGSPASFPIGPYILASTLACPVFLLFAYKVENRLVVAFEKFADAVTLTRKDRDNDLNDFARKFARSLEYHCRKAPYEWFNFYPFWKSESQKVLPSELKSQ